MFVPKIIKICPTDTEKGLYVEWTVPVAGTKPGIAGYTIAYRRSDLDLNFSSQTIIGGHISSHVISCSKSCKRYDIKISAFSYRDFGDFGPIVTWCSSDYESHQSLCSDILPCPDIVKILSTNQGQGIHIVWTTLFTAHGSVSDYMVPVDASSFIIEGFVVVYRRCGLGTQFKEKLIPGNSKRSHVITGTNRCTLYEVRVAVCTSNTRGRFSAPAIIRTGVTLQDSLKLRTTPGPRFKPQLTKISALCHPGIFISWTTPDQDIYPPVHGYVIAYRKVSAYETPYFKCYISGAKSSTHIITGVRENAPYEVKVAAYNTSGIGTYTMPKVVYKEGAKVFRTTRNPSAKQLSSTFPTQRTKLTTSCLVF